MKETARLAVVALAMVCALAAVSVSLGTADAETDGTAIGPDFDWATIADETDYIVTGEVVMDETVRDLVIPSGTTITVADGGILTIDDATVEVAGTITVQDGGAVVLSSTGIGITGTVVAQAGAYISLQSGVPSTDFSVGWNAVGPEVTDNTIFVLSEGAASVSTRTVSDEFLYYVVTLDGTAELHDEGELSYSTNFDVVVGEGSELTVADYFHSRGSVVNHGIVRVSEGAEVTFAGYDFEDNSEAVVSDGAIFNEGSVVLDGFDLGAVCSGPFVNNGTVTVSDGNLLTLTGDVSGHGIIDGDVAGSLTGGIYTADVSDLAAEGHTAYAYSGVHIVVEDSADPVITIGNVLFPSFGDALDLINAGGDFATYSDGVLTLTDDLTDLEGTAIIIADDVVIDGDGHRFTGRFVMDAVDGEAYSVTLRDLVMDGLGSSSFAVFGQNQGDGDVRPLSLTMEGVSVSGYTSKGVYLTNVVDLRVSGCSFNDNATTEQTPVVGDYAFDLNLCGVSDVTVLIEDTMFGGVSGGNGPIKITQRGGVGLTDDVNTDIKNTESATIRSVTIRDCGFDVTGSKVGDIIIGSSPNADGTCRTYNQTFDLSVSGCAATVAYRGAMADGEEDVLRIAMDAADTLTADANGAGLSVRLVGDVDMSGQIRDGVSVVSLDSITVPQGQWLSGRVMFGSDAANGAELDAVVGGADGLVMSLGSVVLSGSAADGAISVIGSGIVEGDLALGSASVSVPEGSRLTIGRDASVSGSGSMSVAGELSVYGNVDMGSVSNTGSIVLRDGGSVAGDVIGEQPVVDEEDRLIIYQISTLHATVGELFRVAVNVSDPAATITVSGADWIGPVDKRVISGTPTEAGTYTITVTAESEGITTQMSFDVVVADPAGDDDGNGIDLRIVAIVILGIVALILIARVVLG